MAVVSSSAKPPISNEDIHARKNIFAAKAMARQPEHEDLRPMSSAEKPQPQKDFLLFALGRSEPSKNIKKENISRT